MANKITVSVMCSDLMNLERDIKELERNGVDWLHIDIMDAHFVPNLTFGPDFPNAMHRVTNMPLDIHLMCEDPEFICSKIDVHAGDIISTHVELKKDFTDFAAKIHEKGAMFGVVVNPDTPVDSVAPHMAYSDMVTLMLVHPGFAGAKLVEGILDKVAEMRQWLDSNGYENVLISVDGSVSCERAELMAGMGANVFVGGTAGVYRKGMELSESIPLLRAAISK
ncbi:MAG: ribulose-phosphate 3-epimerase [Bacteroidales bacterium]|jgi:ribulose-phosphate 3-epimerase|nr:ribulose-phosphate 3-epimerase [Bacteroidales bacterium]MBQ5602938.1 ribulose-phosphate 3-epimerase [Bacteroidales bacterium]